MAALSDQDRQRHSDRAVPDDGHVGVGLGHDWRSGWWPQALMRS
jgi:hypothetical protein